MVYWGLFEKVGGSGMRIVIAPDSFKECATAVEVADAIAEGVRRAVPDAELVLAPMADGGEGTVDALVAATDGVTVDVKATGPMGDRVRSTYGILGDGRTAVIEMAAASGLALVPAGRRDPGYATTYGTGELVRHALDRDVERIIVGIGGSATNDGGAGMAQALGYSLTDADGAELPRGGLALSRLANIHATAKHHALDACEVLVACDVANTLCGPNGASHVYGPQKGADPATVTALDAALRHYAEVVAGQLGTPILDVPGSGAAGGLGGGLVAFTGAQLRPGVEIVAEATGLASKIEGADLVITGEGKLDRQTVEGKTPVGVARIAKAQGVPAIAIAGALGEGYQEVYDHGIDAALSIAPGSMALSESIRHARTLLADTAENLIRTRRWTGS
jgi:glycerate kinase